MKTMVRDVLNKGVRYESLMFVCPGCIAGGPEGYEGLHMLPVNCHNVHTPAWDWDGDLLLPTLSPSILTQGGADGYSRCHSYLRHGVFTFLSDSTHPLSGQTIPIPDLPEWAQVLE